MEYIGKLSGEFNVPHGSYKKGVDKFNQISLPDLNSLKIFLNSSESNLYSSDYKSI